MVKIFAATKQCCAASKTITCKTVSRLRHFGVACEDIALAPEYKKEGPLTPMPKRRVLLVDDEVTVLLTMKAVLEIAGFDVDTAASAREGKSKIRSREYQMVITDMRMESDAADREGIQAAPTAPYHP